MFTVGIDPGKQGALVALGADGQMFFFSLTDLYDEYGAARSSLNPEFVYKLFLQVSDVADEIGLVCCEKPIFKGPRFTIHTTTSMFESYGVLRSICYSRGLPFYGVMPIEWIKHYPNLYHPNQKRDKEESVAEAKRLFPLYSDEFETTVSRGRTKGSLKLLDGRAEASLIALYGREEVLGKKGN